MFVQCYFMLKKWILANILSLKNIKIGIHFKNPDWAEVSTPEMSLIIPHYTQLQFYIILAIGAIITDTTNDQIHENEIEVVKMDFF